MKHCRVRIQLGLLLVLSLARPLCAQLIPLTVARQPECGAVARIEDELRLHSVTHEGGGDDLPDRSDLTDRCKRMNERVAGLRRTMRYFDAPKFLSACLTVA